MNKSDFYGRDFELELMDELWHSDKSEFLILYGRRRVGKTRLLTHWLDRHRERAIYWVAEPTSALHQLRSFSQMLYNFGHPDNQAPLNFTYANWEQAFNEVARLAQGERLALFIDEVTYLIESDAAVSGMLQKVWDHTLKQTNLMLALCGSQRGLMHRELLSYQAPLYGRATAQVELPPLPFQETKNFYPNYDTAEHVAAYSVFGGVPAYLERLDSSAPLMRNIQTQLLTPNTLMQEEPRLLLQDFITDTHNYNGILQAVANGAKTQSAISRHTGLSQGHISKYLSVLRDTGFVERQVPVTEASKKSRRGQYFITDPYLRFYYRFLAANMSQMALRAPSHALKNIEEELPEFIEANTWRELCREWLLKASLHLEEYATLDKTGGAWTRKHEIDVVGISQRRKTLYLGVCSWQSGPVGYGQLTDLISHTGAIVPKSGKWTVHYLGFAREGWTEEAMTMASEVAQSEDEGSNWTIASARLLDLAQVNDDLIRWVN
jgi:hypothetical protein